MSRVTSLSGLFIIGTFISPRRPQPNDPLQIELRRQEQCLLEPIYKFLRTEHCGVQVIYHNVQSFAEHRDRIEKDTVFTASDIILVGKTWALPAEEISVSGFEAVSRSDCVGYASRPRGACCLVSKRLMDHVHDAAGIKMGENEDVIDAATIKLDGVLIAGVYATPGVTNDRIHAFLSRIYTEDGRKIILGDFNRNVL
ncbi:unnamed protein product [Gongylonema pulchrum]|uniref:Tick transposon n=1 Tax=Gongylonema pulchrum TaxID=637853 RepID=A0A183CWG9_9BILA|nr:unnamed protein product [Gongylonema pulchrum]